MYQAQLFSTVSTVNSLVQAKILSRTFAMSYLVALLFHSPHTISSFFFTVTKGTFQIGKSIEITLLLKNFQRLLTAVKIMSNLLWSIKFSIFWPLHISPSSSPLILTLTHSVWETLALPVLCTYQTGPLLRTLHSVHSLAPILLIKFFVIILFPSLDPQWGLSIHECAPHLFSILYPCFTFFIGLKSSPKLCVSSGHLKEWLMTNTTAHHTTTEPPVRKASYHSLHDLKASFFFLCYLWSPYSCYLLLRRFRRFFVISTVLLRIMPSI